MGKLFNIDEEERTNGLSNLLRSVGLLGDSSREISGFSTGMTTRLGLAAALVNDPEILILDEPTSGLDPAGRRSTLELISELGKEKTIFVSSHILSDIDRICSDVGVISKGKGIFSGSMKDMKKSTRSHVIHLELEGDMNGFCQALRTARWVVDIATRGNHGVDVTFVPEIPMADAVQRGDELGPATRAGPHFG